MNGLIRRLVVGLGLGLLAMGCHGLSVQVGVADPEVNSVRTTGSVPRQAPETREEEIEDKQDEGDAAPSNRHTLGDIETATQDPFSLVYFDDFGGLGTVRLMLLFMNRVMHAFLKPPAGGSLDPHLESGHWLWMWACMIVTYHIMFHSKDTQKRYDPTLTIDSLF